MAPCTVHHELAGPADAPVVVLSNSLGSRLAMWDGQLAALAERHRVVRYDLRGHGRSPVPPGPYAIADLGGDLLALLDRLEVERASLVGVSLGGMLSMWVAANAPGRVDRLVPACTSALLGPAEMWEERAQLVDREGPGALADAVVGRWLTPACAAARPALRDRMRAWIAETPAAGYAASCRAIGAMDLRADLPRIAAPTLVIAGDVDPATPPDHGAAIAAAIPGARLLVLEDAAHLANVEHPAAFNAALLAHLEA